MDMGSLRDVRDFTDMMRRLPNLTYIGPIRHTVTAMYDEESWNSYQKDGINGKLANAGDYHSPLCGSFWLQMGVPCGPWYCRLAHLDVYINSPNTSLMQDIVGACV